LNAGERAAFNQVNHPFERVYKKFPPDYAIKKHLRAMKNKYNVMCIRHKDLLDVLNAAEEKLRITMIDEDNERVKASSWKPVARWRTAAVEAAVACRKAARVEVERAEAEVIWMYFKICSFIEDPLFAPALKHDTGGRNNISTSLERLHEDVDLFVHTSDDMRENLRIRCSEVQAYVANTPFVREIAKPVVAGH
jgi:hypothetical protein